ncbi:MAG: GC-type dockerin domain-anchored protein [Phycisphaerales bacterium]
MIRPAAAPPGPTTASSASPARRRALSTTAFGEFNDSITVHVPGMAAGSMVTIFYSVEVRGVLSATAGESSASWTVRTDLGPSPFDMTGAGGMDGPGYAEPGPTGKGFGVYRAFAEVPVGMPTSLHVEYATTALASNTPTTPGNAACDDVKCWWHGVSSVASSTGVVANWSITSQSGTDWTVASRRCMADFGSPGGVSPGDGRLDNNDFIAFTTAFFQHDLAADVGTTAGMFGSDNVLDSNDFISFITLFFQGC